MTDNADIVVDKAESKISDLWTKEDYLAIWAGIAILIMALCLVFAGKTDMSAKISNYNTIIAQEKEKPFQTVALIEATAGKRAVMGNALPNFKNVSQFLATPKKWTTNPLTSFVMTQSEADALNASKLAGVESAKDAAATAKIAALEAQTLAEEANYTNPTLNADAEAATANWSKANAAASKASSGLAKPYNVLSTAIVLAIGIGLLMSIGIILMGNNAGQFLIAFAGVFALALVAAMLGKQANMSYYGINGEIWAIVLGMLIANTVGTPKWLLPGVQVEYYIKTGLVLLGAEVIFSKIIAIGAPGIMITWFVTPIVLISTYIFGQKVLKIESKTLNMVVSADMSVCGTSAAIATAAACRANKEELSLAIGISLLFTAVMMILLPMLIKAIGLNQVVAGAWIGGTIDATGAVAAAGAFLGPTAMQVAATIKMIQNILIGITAFCVAIYWTTKVDKVEGTTVGVFEIWHRFPKFVLGFLALSVFTSILSANLGKDMSYAVIEKGFLSMTGAFRSWFFALAFSSIGLAVNFRALSHYFKGGKPVILYICGQSFNLCLTLTMAYVMFTYVFPEVTASLLAG